MLQPLPQLGSDVPHPKCREVHERVAEAVHRGLWRSEEDVVEAESLEVWRLDHQLDCLRAEYLDVLQEAGVEQLLGLGLHLPRVREVEGDQELGEGASLLANAVPASRNAVVWEPEGVAEECQDVRGQDRAARVDTEDDVLLDERGPLRLELVADRTLQPGGEGVVEGLGL